MALNTTSNLSEEVQDMLSAELLVAPDDVYMFFANGPIQRADDDARTPGTNVIKFNRPTLPTGTYTESSRRLTEATPVSTTAIPIAMTQVSLTLREYAGPHDGSTVKPFGVTEFFKNRSKHNVISIIGEFLRRDRNRFLDVVTANLLLAATNVVTPDGSAEADIGVGQKASVAWLRALNKAMKDAKVPTYDNGRWRLAIGTTDEQNLKADPEYRDAMKELAGANPLFSGHVMSLEGFDIMVTTMLSTDTVGVDDLVPAQQGVAWGKYGIGWGLPLPPSVRAADETDYGREERVIWKSEECIGNLYADLLFRTLTT